MAGSANKVQTCLGDAATALKTAAFSLSQAQVPEREESTMPVPHQNHDMVEDVTASVAGDKAGQCYRQAYASIMARLTVLENVLFGSSREGSAPAAEHANRSSEWQALIHYTARSSRSTRIHGSSSTATMPSSASSLGKRSYSQRQKHTPHCQDHLNKRLQLWNTSPAPLTRSTSRNSYYNYDLVAPEGLQSHTSHRQPLHSSSCVCSCSCLETPSPYWHGDISNRVLGVSEPSTPATPRSYLPPTCHMDISRLQLDDANLCTIVSYIWNIFRLDSSIGSLWLADPWFDATTLHLELIDNWMADWLQLTFHNFAPPHITLDIIAIATKYYVKYCTTRHISPCGTPGLSARDALLCFAACIVLAYKWLNDWPPSTQHWVELWCLPGLLKWERKVLRCLGFHMVVHGDELEEFWHVLCCALWGIEETMSGLEG